MSSTSRRAPTRLRRPVAAGLAAMAAVGLAAACADDGPGRTATAAGAATTPAADGVRRIRVEGTTLAVRVQGRGPLTLVVHGAGEDAQMLEPLAQALVGTGRRVVTYDRRGTGSSGRDAWPGSGADQHADDAAALLRALGGGPAEVVGLSSGGVIALDLAVRHPDVVERAVVWEAPAVGLLPGGAELNRELMGPVDAHLRAHPGDFAGAQAVLLSVILQVPVAADDPAFAATRANAEAMVLDDPRIVEQAFDPAALRVLPLTIAVGRAPNEVVAATTGALVGITGRDPVVVPTDDHDVHLNDPATLAAAIASAR